MNDNFGFEIDFLPIGDSSKSGDAVCMRWGYDLMTDNPNQYVMVVDGGFVSDGEKIIEHIKDFYHTHVIDLIVSTHPHSDHIGGLSAIINDESLKINNLAVHQPWAHTGLKAYFDDGRVTAKSIRKNLKEGLEAAYQLVVDAKRREIPICDWFSDAKGFSACGVKIDCLSPSKNFYDSLLPDFVSTTGEATQRGRRRLECTNKNVAYDKCPLTDDGATSAENESSIVLALTLPSGKIVLLSGDAGMQSLSQVVDKTVNKGLDITKLWAFKVPHHGSVQNLGPTVLKDLLKQDVNIMHTNQRYAFISVARNPPFDHPAKNVVNAILSHGMSVYETHGKLIHLKTGVVPNRNYVSSQKIGPYSEVQQFV